jgi:hypothetical protein
MRLVLGTFARSGIEAALGCDLAVGVGTALRHYAGRDRFPATAELLGMGCLEQLGGTGADIELTLDAETEVALERKAREYGGIAVERLATHAVLVYLADRDAQVTVSSR